MYRLVKVKPLNWNLYPFLEYSIQHRVLIMEEISSETPRPVGVNMDINFCGAGGAVRPWHQVT